MWSPNEKPIVFLYDDAMAGRHADVVLPDEAIDVTTSELHALVLLRLTNAARYVFGDSALVLMDIFVRVNGVEQVAPDLLVVPGAQRGRRTVYRIPDEPVPAVTVEVLSPANYEPEGRDLLAAKRRLLGRIGVPTHIEIDPDRGFVTTWHNHGGDLVVHDASDRYHGPALGGLQVDIPDPGEVTFSMPDGRELLDAPIEMARADTEAARADTEAARADAAALRAEHLADALRRVGVDPETV